MTCVLCGSPQGSELTARGIGTLDKFLQQLHSMSSSSSNGPEKITIGGGGTSALRVCGDCLCDMTLATERAQQLEDIVDSFLEGIKVMEEKVKRGKSQNNNGLHTAINSVIQMLNGLFPAPTTSSKFPAATPVEVKREIVEEVKMKQEKMEDVQVKIERMEEEELEEEEEQDDFGGYEPDKTWDLEEDEEEEETLLDLEEHKTLEEEPRQRHSRPVPPPGQGQRRKVIVVKKKRFVPNYKKVVGLDPQDRKAAFADQFEKYRRTKVLCRVCGKRFERCYLEKHLTRAHNMFVKTEWIPKTKKRVVPPSRKPQRSSKTRSPTKGKR